MGIKKESLRRNAREGGFENDFQIWIFLELFTILEPKNKKQKGEKEQQQQLKEMDG